MVGGVTGEAASQEALGQVRVYVTFAVVATAAARECLPVADGAESGLVTAGVVRVGVALYALSTETLEVLRPGPTAATLAVVLTRSAGVIGADRVGWIITPGVALAIAAVAELAAPADALVPFTDLGDTLRVVAACDTLKRGAADRIGRVLRAAGVGGRVALATAAAHTLGAVSAVDPYALEVAQAASAGEPIGVAYGLRGTCAAASIISGIAGAT